MVTLGVRAPVMFCVVSPVHGHRALPSFPTRRSSDLATLTWVDWFNHRRLLEPIGYIPPAEAAANYYQQQAGPAMAARSEEHTSELQSRGQLVCRVLLEKKKLGNGARTRIITQPATPR